MKKKLNRKYLGIIFILFTAFLIFSNSVFAELTDFSNGTNNEVMNTITKVVAEIGKVGMNVGTANLAVLLTGIAFILFILLQTVFILTGTTDNLLQIPFPDTVIFNKMALFDANFINPEKTNDSPLYIIRTTIASVYDSFVIIAVALFTIVAMIIGIKLALSTIASEKAKYKQAIGCWISGIILLVCLKWLLAGMFKINEEIVQRVYDISTKSKMQFDVFSLASIPLVGSTISQIMSWFGVNASAISFGSVPGYLGLVLKYLLEGAGGNFVGSLVAFVVLGQTFAIITVYLKRVFYCLLLGLIGPLVVAVDTFNRSIGKGSGIFTNWLKQLALTIFMQSFHAVFLLVLINFMVNIGNKISNQYMSSLIIIILTSGLVKFEKLFKQLFGISDSVVGDIKNGAMKAMATMGAVTRAGKAIGDNSKKYNDANRRKADLIASKKKLEQKQSILNAKMGNSGSAGGNDGRPTNSDPTSETTGNNGNSTSSGGIGAKGDDEIKSILRNINNQMMQNKHEQNEQELRNLDKELGKVEADISSAKLAKILTPVSVAAGMAFGFGADDMGAGAMLTTALDHAAEKIGRKGADETRSRLYDETKEKGRENPDVLRQKTTTNIKQEINNTFTLKNLRDVSDILTGKDKNDNSGTKNLKDYKYIKDENDRGHQKISSSVDNL